MPSPLVHAAAGYAAYRLTALSVSPTTGGARPVFAVLGFALVLSMFPDVDAVLGLLTGDLASYHNNLTHSLLAGAAVAALAAWVWYRLRTSAGEHFGPWFGLALACCWGHVALDYFTFGRGVMALWPLTSTRYAAPVPLFYGLHWSRGLVSASHVWTLLSEASFVALAVFVLARCRMPAARSRMAGTPLPGRSH